MASPPKFSVDDVNRFLDRVPFSVPGAALIAAYSFYKARSFLGPSLHFVDHVRANRWLSALLAFVALKALHRTLNRLTRNNGWRADPPRWSFDKGQGDVVLITGGSTGIGKEMVEILAGKTNKIAVLDLAPPTYDAHGVKYYKCDITDAAAIAEVAKQVRAEVGEPTILINNAGIARGKKILDVTPEEFLLTYKVNVVGALNILREFLPHIIKINYNAPRVRTSVICPTKVSTQMGDAMKDTDNQFLSPTLDARWLARQMVRIVESGLSDHLVAPHYAHLLLPNLRSLPDYFRWLVATVGKTHDIITDERNAVQMKTYKLVGELDKKHGFESVVPKPLEGAHES
ncbi:hypothetical protein Rhopal_000225-T1 [Rhodotorula paludigena]|uniref:Uncharacterized protein n=1 Tax=Rhodotorula paludigena TaxID=86838 RepID=A0AAV5GDV8_9BASI|nr:hypothetical protein Rhopal_000225-T1 [Rhodotorula paludigena]